MRTEPGARRGPAAVAALVAGLGLGACGTSEPSEPFVDFVVTVTDERFVLRIGDPEAIALAYDAIRGDNQRFPIGYCPWAGRIVGVKP